MWGCAPCPKGAEVYCRPPSLPPRPDPHCPQPPRVERQQCWGPPLVLSLWSLASGMIVYWGTTGAGRVPQTAPGAVVQGGVSAHAALPTACPALPGRPRKPNRASGQGGTSRVLGS